MVLGNGQGYDVTTGWADVDGFQAISWLFKVVPLAEVLPYCKTQTKIHNYFQLFSYRVIDFLLYGALYCPATTNKEIYIMSFIDFILSLFGKRNNDWDVPRHLKLEWEAALREAAEKMRQAGGKPRNLGGTVELMPATVDANGLWVFTYNGKPRLGLVFGNRVMLASIDGRRVQPFTMLHEAFHALGASDHPHDPRYVGIAPFWPRETR